MSANDRVSPPSSSRPCKAALGVRSPAATCLTPSASNNRGRASWFPSTTASRMAPNTARNRLSVRVPMYIRRSPSRPKARSWYSRLATWTAIALATKAGAMGSVTCRKRASSSNPIRGVGTNAMALIRAALPPALDSAPSSTPSTWVTTPWLRALRSCCDDGRSGLMSKRDFPALAISLPVALHSTMSLAPSCSPRRSRLSAAEESEVPESWAAAVRVLFPRSFASVSRAVRPRLSPAVSAPSTFTSNQLSIERETNW